MRKKNAASMEDEERLLLKSLGLLHLLQESSKHKDVIDTDEGKTKGTVRDSLKDVVVSNNSQEIESADDMPSPMSSLFWNKLQNDFIPISSAYDDNKATTTQQRILLGIGGTLFLLPHLAIILSLPPVLRRRGAPYLPTFGNKMNLMFDLIRSHVSINKSNSSSNNTLLKKSSGSLKFVDLGSGDGRVVFRAAREGIFEKSVGYEINPALHMWVKLRQLVTPKYWSSTQFYLGDLWKTKLHNYDVVALYGLYPIMGRLGKKLQDELKHDAIVVSNVFEIPNWKPSMSSGKGVYLYQVPECYGGTKKTQETCRKDEKW